MALVEELWSDSKPDSRCPHVRKDDQGCYCSKCGVSNIMPAHQRELQGVPCDAASLQLYCLDADRCQLCIIFKEDEK